MSDDDGPNKKNKYGPPVLSKKINKFNNHGIIFGKIKKKKVRFFFFYVEINYKWDGICGPIYISIKRHRNMDEIFSNFLWY